MRYRINPVQKNNCFSNSQYFLSLFLILFCFSSTPSWSIELSEVDLDVTFVTNNLMNMRATRDGKELRIAIELASDTYIFTGNIKIYDNDHQFQCRWTWDSFKRVFAGFGNVEVVQGRLVGECETPAEEIKTVKFRFQTANKKGDVNKATVMRLFEKEERMKRNTLLTDKTIDNLRSRVAQELCEKSDNFSCTDRRVIDLQSEKCKFEIRPIVEKCFHLSRTEIRSTLFRAFENSLQADTGIREILHKNISPCVHEEVANAHGEKRKVVLQCYRRQAIDKQENDRLANVELLKSKSENCHLIEDRRSLTEAITENNGAKSIAVFLVVDRFAPNSETIYSNTISDPRFELLQSKFQCYRVENASDDMEMLRMLDLHRIGFTTMALVVEGVEVKHYLRENYTDALYSYLNNSLPKNNKEDSVVENEGFVTNQEMTPSQSLVDGPENTGSPANEVESLLPVSAVQAQNLAAENKLEQQDKQDKQDKQKKKVRKESPACNKNRASKRKNSKKAC